MKEIAHKVRNLVEDKPLWDGFLELLDSKIDYLRKQNDSANTNDVIKNQGGIAALNNLKYLRDEVKQALKQ